MVHLVRTYLGCRNGKFFLNAMLYGKCINVDLDTRLTKMRSTFMTSLPPIAGGGGGKCVTADGCLGPGDPRPYSPGLGGIIIAVS